MKKITILALHLGYGGIERSISSLANSICNDYEIEIISNYKLYEKSSFYIDPRISIKYLMSDLKPNKQEFKQAIKNKNILSIIKEGIISLKVLYFRRKKMISAIRTIDSDIIISTRDIHNKLLATYGPKSSLKIGWEHNHHNDSKKYINKLTESLKNLDFAVFVSKELTSFYQEKLRNEHCQCIYIPNSIDFISETLSSLANPHLISVGRLSPEKGYVDLIKIMDRLHEKYSNWHLDIVGDGEEYEELVHLRNELNLESVITFHGFQGRKYINSLLLNSSIYLMTSYTESFGIVLLEAFAYGIPCMAFDSAQGAREVIDDEKNGYLIKNRNMQDFLNKLVHLIENEELREKFGKNGYEKVHQFDSDEIKKEWINLFMEIKK